MRRRRTRKPMTKIETVDDAGSSSADSTESAPQSKALEALARWLVDWNDVPPRGVS